MTKEELFRLIEQTKLQFNNKLLDHYCDQLIDAANLSTSSNVFLSLSRSLGNFDLNSKRRNELITVLDNDVDVTAMMEEIRSQEENWYVETGRQKSIPVQSETESIPLVKPIPLLGVTGHPSQWDSHRYRPTPLYEKYPNIISWLNNFSLKYGEKIARVALVRLKVDGQVGSHIDFGEYYRHRNRYHLCLDGAYYYHVNNESKLIETGTLFRFDNDMPHWAVNEGNIPRISVIFDTES
jgi:hypothetical protein